MLRLVLSEYQKHKRTFTKKLAWLAPLVTMLLCGILGVGSLFQSGSYNWWYTMLLPGALTIICGGVIQKDKKKLNYRAILSLSVYPEKIWMGKLGVCILLYSISCFVFFAGVTLGGVIFGSSIPLPNSILGSILLFATFLWQIPLCMVLVERMGVFSAVLINLVGNVACVIFAATSAYWWIPYAIPSRLMCAVIKVLPNGLPVPAGDPLLTTSVILPGTLINLILFLALAALTMRFYRKLEAK